VGGDGGRGGREGGIRGERDLKAVFVDSEVVGEQPNEWA